MSQRIIKYFKILLISFAYCSESILGTREAILRCALAGAPPASVQTQRRHRRPPISASSNARDCFLRRGRRILRRCRSNSAFIIGRARRIRTRNLSGQRWNTKHPRWHAALVGVGYGQCRGYGHFRGVEAFEWCRGRRASARRSLDVFPFITEFSLCRWIGVRSPFFPPFFQVFRRFLDAFVRAFSSPLSRCWGMPIWSSIGSAFEVVEGC